MDLEAAVREARDAISANDLERLGDAVDAQPALLQWRDGDGQVLLQETTSYANFPGIEHEEHWNRRECAEFLIDAGADFDPRVALRVIDTGAPKMLAMLRRKGVLPINLRTLAALGERSEVEACFVADGSLNDRARPDASLRAGYAKARFDWPDPCNDELIVADGFLYACRLGHRPVAEFLLDRCLERDADLAARVAGWEGRGAFLEYLLEREPDGTRFALESGQAGVPPSVIWQRVVDLRLHEAMDRGDAGGICALLEREPFVLGKAFVDQQAKLLQVAAYSDDALAVIEAVVDSEAAITKIANPPDVAAHGHALEYGHADYVPTLSRIWAVPDDLPHAAGLGDFAKVRSWFDEQGRVQLGTPHDHNPFPSHDKNPSEQDVLDRAFAWAVINARYEVADFLLAHGADLDTRWSTHEPASVLHECAIAGRREQVEWLVAKGIDLTIRDARFDGTAEGWARYNGQAEIAEFLADKARGSEG